MYVNEPYACLIILWLQNVIVQILPAYMQFLTWNNLIWPKHINSDWQYDREDNKDIVRLMTLWDYAINM